MQQGGLAGTAGADDRHALAAGNVQGRHRQPEIRLRKLKIKIVDGNHGSEFSQGDCVADLALLHHFHGDDFPRAALRRNAKVGGVFIDPRVDVSPVFDGARHLPGDALHKAALGLARGRFRVGDFDFLDAGDRPALLLHDQALLDLQVQVGQQVAGDALGQRVVDIGFAAIVEAAIDVAQAASRPGRRGPPSSAALCPAGTESIFGRGARAGAVPGERRLLRP